MLLMGDINDHNNGLFLSEVYRKAAQSGHWTFLAMEVPTGQAQLLELMKAVDGTMEEFTLDTFYKGLVDSHEDGAFLLRLDCQELQR
ncbi:U6 snRNA phosphodiesterase 1-like [Salvelinus alpinus]